MGKASRWFRTFLGKKQSDPKSNPNPKQHKDKQRKCTFVKSSSSLRPPPSPPSSPSNNYDLPTSSSYVYGGADGGDDVCEHAIAVAEASSANAIREEREFDELHCAAILIQSYFRGYLARRALRALKGLVKLQALVRGHIMRKKTSETIRCMQAMLRAQARAKSVRAYIPKSPYASNIKSCPINHSGPPTPEKFEQVVRAKSIQHNHSPKIKRNSSKSSTRLNTMSQDRTNFGSSWSNPRMEHNPVWDSWGATSSTRTSHIDDDRGDETLETDTGKPLRRSSRRSLFEASHSGLLTSNNNFYCRPENNQPYLSPVSQGGRSQLSGYSDCPSYMAYTESSKAKFRSLSAPKQRPEFEKKNSTKNYSVHEGGEHYARSNAQRVSSTHANFASKAYPGSGRLGRVGMPLKDSTIVYYSGYLN